MKRQSRYLLALSGSSLVAFTLCCGIRSLGYKEAKEAPATERVDTNRYLQTVKDNTGSLTSPDAVAESRRLAKELNIPAEVVGQWGAGESPTVGDADAEHIIRQNELNVETKKSSPDDDARKQRIAQTLNVPVDTIDKWAQAGAKADDTLPARRKYTEADFAALTQNEPFFSSGFFGAWLVLSLNLVAITFTLLGFKDWPHNGWKRLAITASGIATAILVSLGLLPSYSGNNGLFIVAALPLASLIFFGTWLTVATVAWIRRGFG